MKKTIKKWQGVVLVLVIFALFGGFNKAQAASNTWENVGLAGFSTANAPAPSIAFNPSDNLPYVAYSDGARSYKATVMKYNGSSWAPLGNAGFSAGQANNVTIAFNPSDNQPYVVYEDYANSGKLTVMRFDGASWIPVGTIGFSLGHQSFLPSLAFKPSTNQPYVTYVDGGYPPVIDENGFMDMGINNQIIVMKFDGSSWGLVGGTGFSPGSSSPKLAFDPSTKEPYVAYMDGDNSQKITVKKFNGSSWGIVGTAGIENSSGGAMDMAFNPSNKQPYLVYEDNAHSYKAIAKRFDGSSWVPVGDVGFSLNGVSRPKIAFGSSDSRPYVVYYQYSSGKIVVMRYDDPTWNPIGDAVTSTGYLYDFGIAVDPSNGQPYVVYLDTANSYKATVKRFDSTDPVWSSAINFNDPGASKDNLVVITHGWEGSATNSWMTQMRDNIYAKTNPSNTAVRLYDWHAGAHGLNPDAVYDNAVKEGEAMAEQIKQEIRLRGSNSTPIHLHLIAHSAGSNAIQTAVDKLADSYQNNPDNLPKPLIHLTFLDAFAPKGENERYGDLHDFTGYAEQYVDMPDLMDTNMQLPRVTNFDVTYLTSSSNRTHTWPIDLYNKSVADSEYTLPVSGEKNDFKFGFPFSIESKNHIDPVEHKGKWCIITNVSEPYRRCLDDSQEEKRDVILTDPNPNSPTVISGSGTLIDVGQFIGFDGSVAKGTLPSIIMNSKVALLDQPNGQVDVSVVIPKNVLVTSSVAWWNGIFAAPKTIEATSSTTWRTAFDIGSSGAGLSFSEAVEITLKNQAGSGASFSNNGFSFTEIPNCRPDQRGGENLSGGACKMDDSGNLVIWTQHFTTFVTYLPDTVPLEIAINTPADGAKYVLNSKVDADWSVADEGSGVDTATGTAASGNKIDTSSIGQKEFTVSATDKAGNSIAKTVKYDVVYSFGGFQNPTTKDKPFNGNSTIPVKFQLTDASGKSVSGAAATLTIDNGIKAMASGNSNDGNKFRNDGNQYIFNLSLKNMALAAGSHTLNIQLDDGTSNSQVIIIK